MIMPHIHDFLIEGSLEDLFQLNNPSISIMGKQTEKLLIFIHIFTVAFFIYLAPASFIF